METARSRAYIFYYLYAQPAWRTTKPYLDSLTNASVQAAGSAIRYASVTTPAILESLGNGAQMASEFVSQNLTKETNSETEKENESFTVVEICDEENRDEENSDEFFLQLEENSE